MSTHSPTLAYDLGRDVRALVEMSSHLTPYLYEKDMYGQLGGDLPKLTLGGLLMRLYRLTRLDGALSAEQQRQVQEAQANFEAKRSEWSVHYESKLQHELRARVEALERFLNECTGDPQGCAAGYPTEAEKRIMIEHLRQECAVRGCLNDEIAARLANVDQKLRRLLVSGEFLIADERLKAVYPLGEFWWLYGSMGEGRR